MTKNEIFETVAQAVAEKTEYRAVAQFHGEHEGETLLVDFGNDDGTDFDEDCICVWSHQKEMDELAWGTFTDYVAVVDFLVKFFDGKEVSFYVEGF